MRLEMLGHSQLVSIRALHVVVAGIGSGFLYRFHCVTDGGTGGANFIQESLTTSPI